MVDSSPSLSQDARVAAIRQHVAMNPHDSATEVIAALSRLGQTASPALVQQVKQEMAIAEAAHDEPTRSTSPARLAKDEPSSADLAAAEQFVAHLGGLAQARRALEHWAMAHPET